MENKTQIQIGEYSKSRRKKKLWKRVLSCLMAVTVFTTTYAMILPAITHEGQAYCGYDEHVHSEEAGCYTEVRTLVCELPEGGHVHTEQCYEERETLVCELPELIAHSHGEECYDGETLICELPEIIVHIHSEACYDGEELICGLPEVTAHIHSEACYDGEELVCGVPGIIVHSHSAACYDGETLICGLPEITAHSHSAACYAVEKTLICGEEEAAHEHTDLCYIVTRELTCEKETHEHSLQCFSNPEADVETAEIWERSVRNVELTGVWADDVLAIAETQIGYAESEKNYTVTDDGEVKGYTRYGAWYGDPYGDWCAMFASFVYNYACVDRNVMPIEASCSRWADSLNERGLWHAAADGYAPKPGDLVFFNRNGGDSADHVGLVCSVEEKSSGVELTTIEGNNGAKVKKFTYDRNDTSIFGYGELPENPDPAAQVVPSAQGDDRANGEPVVLTARTADGVTVTLTADEGILPYPAEELTLSVTTIEDENAVALIEGETRTAEGEKRETRLFDIKILRGEEEVQPLGEVEVHFSGISAPNGDAQAFYVDPETETVEEMPMDRDLTMTTPHFTIYGVSWTVGDIADDYVPGSATLSVALNSRITGTAPFDANNNAGNDSSADNEYVRSYDHVFYNIGYTANLVDAYNSTTAGYKNAKLYIEAAMPIDSAKAEFDLEAMSWLSGASVTESGGVQTLTGYYQMTAGSADYVVPGTGAVRLAVFVKGMADMEGLPAPVVQCWLDPGSGSPDVKAVSGIEPVTVRAAAPTQFDVGIVSCQVEDATVDRDTNTISQDAVLDGHSGGRILHTELKVSLTDDVKGMKGYLDEPYTIEFDLDPRYYCWLYDNPNFTGTPFQATGVDDALTGGFLWDYSPVHADYGNTNGVLGRKLSVAFEVSGRRNLPFSKLSYGTSDNAAFDSGTMSAYYAAPQYIHVKFENVRSNGDYPQYSADGSNPADKNVLCTGTVHIYLDRQSGIYANQTGLAERVTIAVEKNSRKVNGQPFQDSVTTNDSLIPYQQSGEFSGSGTWYDSHLFYADNMREESIRGALTLQPGDEFFCRQRIEDNKTVNLIDYCFNIGNESGSVYEPVDAFASNPAGLLPGDWWQEVYYLPYTRQPGQLPAERAYRSMADLYAAGETHCACVWVRIQGPENSRYDLKYPNWSMFAYVKLKVKEDAPIMTGAYTGRPNAIQMFARTRHTGWSLLCGGGTNVLSQPTDIQTEEVRYSTFQQWSFNEMGRPIAVSGVRWWCGVLSENPNWVTERPVGSHDQGGYGWASVYIRSIDAKITNTVKTLQTVNVGIGQRAADFELAPALPNPSGTASATTVTVTETLPAGLTYTPNSAWLGGAYTPPTDPTQHGTITPTAGSKKLVDNGTVTDAITCSPSTSTGEVTFTVTPNADGTTTLTWTLTNVTPGADIPKLYFSAEIGDENDPQSDVKDGDVLTATATVSAQGYATVSADASIRIQKFDSATAIKLVKHETVARGEPIVYAIEYTNDSGNVVPYVEIRDILPYNGDPRGSSFSGSYSYVITKVPMNAAAGDGSNWSMTLSHIIEADLDNAVADPFSNNWTAIGGDPLIHQMVGTNIQPYARMRFQITLTPTGNQVGDVYANDVAMQSRVSASTLKTAVVRTTVVDADLKLVKVDSADATKKLGGAVFTLVGTSANAHDDTLYADPSATTFPQDVSKTVTTGDGENGTTLGEAVLSGIPVGEYTLTETVVPTGYKGQTATWTVEVHRDGSVVVKKNGADDPNFTAASGADPATLTVENVCDTVGLYLAKQIVGPADNSSFPITLRISGTGVNANTVITGSVHTESPTPSDTDMTPVSAALDDATGEYTVEFSVDISSDTQWTFAGIPVGATVTVTETRHDGYTVLIKELTRDTNNQWQEGMELSNTSTYTYTATALKGLKVVNTIGKTLPNTGGPGTFLYTLGGIALMGIPLMYGLTRRRRERRFNG